MSELLKAAQQFAAVCVHSKHPSNGARTAAELECKHGVQGKLYRFPPGGGSALPVCPSCPHFHREAFR